MAAAVAALAVGNAPAVATGIAAALKAKGRTDVRVLGQGGDGGTVDIGFACLSGMGGARQRLRPGQECRADRARP